MAKTLTILTKSKSITHTTLLLFLSIISQYDPTLARTTTTGFSTDLIHRDSPQSPSFDPSSSPSQRTINALKRSFSRAKRSPESNLIYSGGDYLLKYSVGNPPVPALGIADTGSDVIWTQCQPCTKCFNQSIPLFSPKNSRTYRKIHCKTNRCKSFRQRSCTTAKNYCLYGVMYGDNSFSYGELAMDTFALAGNRVSIRKTMFGCGFNNGGIFSGTESGIVGLGAGKTSLVRQLGRSIRGKFSYCLNPPDNPNSSRLHFGSNARVSGKGVVSTPLVKKVPDTYYHVTLEGISVGSQKIEVLSDCVHGHRNRTEGNIILDSGTTLTFLPADLYSKFEKALRSSIKMKEIKDPSGVLNLCFFSRKDVLQIPDITVHFRGGDVKLRYENVFVRTSDVSLCLGAQPTNSVAVYGNMAQINFLVGYDLVKGIVSFKAADCGNLS